MKKEENIPEEEFIKENILLDTGSVQEQDGKITVKCRIGDSILVVKLPKTVNRLPVIDAIQKNELTDAMMNYLVKAVQKEMEQSGLIEKPERIRATIQKDTYQQMLYWSKKRGCSINEYLTMAVEHMIAWENQDYDLPTLEQQRLNQLIDTIGALSSDIRCLETITSEGFKSLIGLTRGDNYLLEEGDDL